MGTSHDVVYADTGGLGTVNADSRDPQSSSSSSSSQATLSRQCEQLVKDMQRKPIVRRIAGDEHAPMRGGVSFCRIMEAVGMVRP